MNCPLNCPLNRRFAWNTKPFFLWKKKNKKKNRMSSATIMLSTLSANTAWYRPSYLQYVRMHTNADLTLVYEVRLNQEVYEKDATSEWFAPKTQISLRIRSLFSVFVIHIKKVCILGYPKCAQWRFWSDCANEQADLNLCWAHMSDGTIPDVSVRIVFWCQG